MSTLLDFAITPKVVRVQEAIGDKPPVDISVFGLNTADLIYLVETHSKVMGAFITSGAKEDRTDLQSAFDIANAFPAFGAACIACATKNQSQVSHVLNYPPVIFLQLLSAVVEKTFPGQDLKKSLEQIAPLVVPLLKKLKTASRV